MIAIHEITKDISCFHVPYKDIFVGIYVINTDCGTVLFDAAANEHDVDTWICPALKQLGVEPSYIFISHDHTDHSGGLPWAAKAFPNAPILSSQEAFLEKYPNAKLLHDGEVVCDVLQVVTIPGHTLDATALLDKRTNTLVSGDCLQSYGIFGSGKWYANIHYPTKYVEAIQKLKKLPVENVASAHDYHPHGMVHYGAQAAEKFIDSCLSALDRIRCAIISEPQKNSEQLAQQLNDGSVPTVSADVVEAVRKAVAQGTQF